MHTTNLTVSEIVDLLGSLRASDAIQGFDEKKQALTFVDETDTACTLTLPPIFPSIDGGSAQEIRRQIGVFAQTYTIALIQAGAAAIGTWKGGELERHKVIKTYMVRKKQGKSQLKFLKSRGKSRVGSRIRLQNSLRFCENINTLLTRWDVAQTSETILLALPTNLKNLLFTSNVPVPFEKTDPRIKKVPVDVRIPSYKELCHIQWVLSRGTLHRGE